MAYRVPAQTPFVAPAPLVSSNQDVAPTARKNSPCVECLRRKREIIRPARLKQVKTEGFCRAGRVFSRGAPTGGSAGRVFSRCMPERLPSGELCRRISRSPAAHRAPHSGALTRPEACAYAPGSRGRSSPGLVPACLPLAREGEVHEEQVQRHDDGRDEEAGDTQGTIVRVAAHDLGRSGEAHERDDREGNAEGQGNLRHH